MESETSPSSHARNSRIRRYRFAGFAICATLATITVSALLRPRSHAAQGKVAAPIPVRVVRATHFSQALTLFTTPVVYVYMERLRERLGKLRLTRA